MILRTFIDLLKRDQIRIISTGLPAKRTDRVQGQLWCVNVWCGIVRTSNSPVGFRRSTVLRTPEVQRHIDSFVRGAFEEHDRNALSVCDCRRRVLPNRRIWLNRFPAYVFARSSSLRRALISTPWNSAVIMRQCNAY